MSRKNSPTEISSSGLSDMVALLATPMCPHTPLQMDVEIYGRNTVD